MLIHDIREMRRKAREADRRELRNYGLIMWAGLGVIGWLVWQKGNPACLVFFSAGGVFLLMAFVQPFALRPLYALWMALAAVMGYVTTGILLSLIYYGMFTPIAMLAKLFGRDLLRQKIEPHATSYWVRRNPKSFHPESAEKMY